MKQLCQFHLIKKLELLKTFPHFNAHPHQNFEKFLDELEEKANAFGIKDSEKLELLPLLLHGPASGKIQYLQPSKSSKSKKQWQDACEQLIIIMEKVKIAETSKIMVQQIRQDDQTVMEYATKMEKLADDTNKFGEQADVMGQEELVKQFIRGLQHNIKKVIRRQKYSTFSEVVKAASDEEQQQTIKKATAVCDQMSLESGQQRQMFQQRRGVFGNRGGEQKLGRDDWNCSCGYKNFAFRRFCNSCKFRHGDGNGPNRGNFNRGNYGNLGNFKRGGGKLGNRGNNHGRGNLNNYGQQQQHGQQKFIKNAVHDKNRKKISNQQQKRHQRSHSDPPTDTTTKKNKQKLEKNGEATVDLEKEEPALYLD